MFVIVEQCVERFITKYEIASAVPAENNWKKKLWSTDNYLRQRAKDYYIDSAPIIWQWKFSLGTDAMPGKYQKQNLSVAFAYVKCFNQFGTHRFLNNV